MIDLTLLLHDVECSGSDREVVLQNNEGEMIWSRRVSFYQVVERLWFREKTEQ